jgi:hypothetical protein
MTMLGGGVPLMQTTYYANDPRLDAAQFGWFVRGSSAYKNVTSLSDAVRVTQHVTLTPGSGVIVAGASNSQGDHPFGGVAITPHMAAAWDPTHDSRTVVRGSFGNYVDVDTTRLARHSLGSQVSQTCQWDPVTMTYSADCSYDGGPSSQTVGLPCGPSGIGPDGRSCKESLRVPGTWEYTIGAEREIFPGVALGSDFIYRRYSHPFETRETNRIWNDTGPKLTLDGYRNGKPETIQDLETPNAARRRYLGLTTSLHKRQGAVRANVAYTWSRLEGNVLDGTDNAWGDIPPRDSYLYGFLPDDSRHAVMATSSRLRCPNRWSRRSSGSAE